MTHVAPRLAAVCSGHTPTVHAGNSEAPFRRLRAGRVFGTVDETKIYRYTVRLYNCLWQSPRQTPPMAFLSERALYDNDSWRGSSRGTGELNLSRRRSDATEALGGHARQGSWEESSARSATPSVQLSLLDDGDRDSYERSESPEAIAIRFTSPTRR